MNQSDPPSSLYKSIARSAKYTKMLIVPPIAVAVLASVYITVDYYRPNKSLARKLLGADRAIVKYNSRSAPSVNIVLDYEQVQKLIEVIACAKNKRNDLPLAYSVKVEFYRKETCLGFISVAGSSFCVGHSAYDDMTGTVNKLTFEPLINKSRHENG